MNAPSKILLSSEEVDNILKLAVAGANEMQLISAMDGWSKPKKDQAYVVIEKYFIRCGEIDPDKERGRAMARLNLIFLNALKVADFKTCLAVQKEINKLGGLYESR